ncbi:MULTISPECIES: DUF2788 domain-containing protein [Deefgea]|uniref:DUF2788 domain-containing protein n=2 Tax=Deefgea TaxID=400947 RepID=A0A6M8SSL6_9NEIS|nr:MULTISPECIES: DUF2788 domain-containing protein [Deefgea]MBM5575042.1 DUF2788 domain-containing protein [Deefgea sp. CFH1-16]MCB5195774.1 DUF2788 domain-containing protein [Deefgea salmonis]QKJ68175.1 DUF2788 domain-containing protein [Deefgea piscis]QZA82681.1 DUF2788 domain-containing protein [Deefgea piscis]
MDEEQFTTLSVTILCSALIIYMGFIIYNLAKESKAGKYGTIVLFFVLGFGMLGFIAKEILSKVLLK